MRGLFVGNAYSIIAIFLFPLFAIYLVYLYFKRRGKKLIDDMIHVLIFIAFITINVISFVALMYVVHFLFKNYQTLHDFSSDMMILFLLFGFMPAIFLYFKKIVKMSFYAEKENNIFCRIISLFIFAPAFSFLLILFIFDIK